MTDTCPRTGAPHRWAVEVIRVVPPYVGPTPSYHVPGQWVRTAAVFCRDCQIPAPTEEEWT